MSTIVVTTEERRIEAEKGDDLLSILRSAGIHIAADCGGHGTCGKCAVDIVTKDGTERVLACRYRVLTDISVRLPDKDAGGIKTANRTGDLDLSYDAAACDLGTTTVSIAVVRNGQLFEKTELNRLVTYGSDVISRASYIRENDALGKLSGELKSQIYEMTETLCAENHVSLPEEICIGGNTVILPGVHIGNNAVIGAGSVVTKDIPDWCIAVGNPCRVQKKITEADKRKLFRDEEIDDAAWEDIMQMLQMSSD